MDAVPGLGEPRNGLKGSFILLAEAAWQPEPTILMIPLLAGGLSREHGRVGSQPQALLMGEGQFR